MTIEVMVKERTMWVAFNLAAGTDGIITDAITMEVGEQVIFRNMDGDILSPVQVVREIGDRPAHYFTCGK